MRAETFQRVATFADATRTHLDQLRRALLDQLDSEPTPPSTMTARQRDEWWENRTRQFGELAGLEAAVLVVQQQLAEVRGRYVQAGGVSRVRPR